MYGRSSPSRIAPADEDEEMGSTLRGNLSVSEPVTGLKVSSSTDSADGSSSDTSESELTATTSESSHGTSQQALKVLDSPPLESPYTIKSRKVSVLFLRVHR